VAAGTLGTLALLALDDDGTGACFSSCVISPEDRQHTVVSESCFPPCPSASFRRPPAVVVFPDEVSLFFFASVVVFSTPSPVNVAVVVIVAVVSSPADLATYTAGRGGSMVVQRGL